MPKRVQIRWAAMGGLLLMSCLPAAGQANKFVESPARASSPEAPLQPVLEDGTPVKLRAGRTVSSADAHVGDMVDFVAVHEVMAGDILVIPRGSVAWGTVVEAHGKRRFGLGGKLKIRLNAIQLGDGSKAALRTEKVFKGGGHTTAMATGMAVTAVAYLPATPALLFLHGKDSVILQGTEVTAYVQGDFPLERAKFRGKARLEGASPEAGSMRPFADSPMLAENNQAELDAILDFLPRRVLDGNGNEGDMVNLAFLGKQEELEQVFEQAGWVGAIHSKRRAVLHAAYHPKNNVAMPMSRLFLFGRPQDYGYVMNDAVSSTTRRHHIRIWKTDYEIEGRQVWVGAATHDIGIEKDSRKLGLTHKIDPDVDAERDYVGGSMMKTQSVARAEYVLPSCDVITHASTATGGKYHSDGQMLVLALKDKEELRAAEGAADTPH